MKNEEWISEDIRKIKSLGQFRSLKIYNKNSVNFSSNDYLNISSNKNIIASASDILHKYGIGSGASRLVTGTLPIHKELEKNLAKFKGYPEALVYGSGYLANMGVIPAIVSRGDLIITDRLSHASIMDAAINSRAKLIRFNHNDTDHLKNILEKHRNFSGKVLVVTESVFSMDGDIAPLEKITKTCSTNSAMLMVDEAHSTGIFGEHGEGLVHKLGLNKSVNISMGTFSKALGSYGGFICCSSKMKEYLINTSRTFIYSTSLPPAVSASQLGAINYLQRNPGIGKQLLKKATLFKNKLISAGLNTGESQTQIIPIITGNTEKSLEFASRLQEASIAAIAIRPPTVPEGAARVRFSITLAHSNQLLKESVEKIITIAKKIRLI